MSSPASTDSSAASLQPEVSVEFKRECILFFGEVVQVFGLGKSVGQIYGLLFASPQPLTFTDIAESLDISRGSTSQGLNFLRELGAVRATAGEHDRQFFEPELELRKLVAGVIKDRVDPVVRGGAVRIKQLREHAKASPNAAGVQFSQDRLKKLESWRRQMGLLLPILKTILGPSRA